MIVTSHSLLRKALLPQRLSKFKQGKRFFAIGNQNERRVRIKKNSYKICRFEKLEITLQSVSVYSRYAIFRIAMLREAREHIERFTIDKK
ncbi:MAG: hypothetical protein K2M52_03355 [Paramuribaculum sp.]|nr:hypothetical protein [Paramuribaculum sp.]